MTYKGISSFIKGYCFGIARGVSLGFRVEKGLSACVA